MPVTDRNPRRRPVPAPPIPRVPGRPRPWPTAALPLALFLIALGALAAPEQPRSGLVPTSDLTGSATLLPSRGEVESRIKETESATGLDDTAKAALIEAYRRTLSNLESVAKLDAKTAEYNRALTEAPGEAARLRRQQEGASADAGPPDLAADPGLATDEIDQRLAKAQAEAALEETRIAELDKTIEAGGSRPKEARARIAELRQSLERLDADQRQTPAGGQSGALDQANAWGLATLRQARLAELRMLEQELTSQGVREDLYRARRELAAQSLAGIKRRQGALETLQVARRKADAEQAQLEAQAAQREAADKHPLVQEAVEQNAEIGDALSLRAEQLAQFNDQLAEIERERARVEEDFRGARERVDAAGLNQALGQVLIDRRHQLPDLRQTRKEIGLREERIAEASLRQIRFREEQRSLRNLDEAIAALAAGDADARTRPVRAQLKEALDQRRALLDKAVAAEDEYIRKQSELNYAADRLIESARVYDAFLAENLLWVRSALPVGLGTLIALPASLAWLVSRDGWGEALEVLLHELARSPLSWLAILAASLLLGNARRLRRAILATAEPLRRVRTDRFRYTLRAMGLTLLAAAWAPLLCFALGRELALSSEATPFTRAIGNALIQVSIGFYYLRAFRIMCIPGGLADRHFRWESAVLMQIRRNLRWFTPFIVPVSLVAIAIYQINDPAHTGSLGRLSLIAAMCGVAVFFARLLNPRTGVFGKVLAAQPEGWVNRLRNLWYPAVVGTPLALAALAIAGYLYTAGTLFESLVATAWLALALVVLHQSIVRWLVVTRRRLALQAALERQAARRAHAESDKPERSEAGGPSPLQPEEPEVDWASLDDQTRKLTNALVAFASFFGIWLIWVDMLPAFNLLDQIALWSTERVEDGTARRVPVSVADVGLVLLIVVVGAVAAKNLPGLLEIVLLQSTRVTAGSRYAIRTLASYTITIVAVLAAFGTLGLSWSKVQWLAAALSVGIGFGLQEIVANFISGIIILFERPVRVGDVITIGDTTGSVTNIQIRATTIRNWDRQELLVPNKELITGRLLNWTLTDQTNRITIPIGVEYGSDIQLALTLLARAADENPRVLKDPAPVVSMEGFGDNALALVLRCFLELMEHRVAVTTELCQAIDRSFREHGIGIAFPQRDIHVTAREPLDIRLHGAFPGAAPTPPATGAEPAPPPPPPPSPPVGPPDAPWAGPGVARQGAPAGRPTPGQPVVPLVLKDTAQRSSPPASG